MTCLEGWELWGGHGADQQGTSVPILEYLGTSHSLYSFLLVPLALIFPSMYWIFMGDRSFKVEEVRYWAYKNNTFCPMIFHRFRAVFSLSFITYLLLCVCAHMW